MLQAEQVLQNRYQLKKPSNLILGEDKQVYLVDFGAVQDRAAKEGATFTVVGTYGYALMD